MHPTPRLARRSSNRFVDFDSYAERQTLRMLVRDATRGNCRRLIRWGVHHPSLGRAWDRARTGHGPTLYEREILPISGGERRLVALTELSYNYLFSRPVLGSDHPRTLRPVF